MSAHLMRGRMRGLSLIEVMIALLIGSILLLALVQVFSASRAASQTSEGMARVQENARFAMDYLQRDLRMAGHFGCVNDQAHLLTPGALVNHTAASAGFPVSIRGYDATGSAPGGSINLATPAAGWTPGLPTAFDDLGALAGSDIIELRYLGNQGVPVSTITHPTTSSTLISVPPARWNALTTDGVANPTMFGIADCTFADLFPASAVNATGGTVTLNATIDRYTPQPAGQTMLYRAESLVYYVAPGAGGGRSLWRARADNSGAYPATGREELVEGIESLQFIYGLDRVTTVDTTAPSGYIDDYRSASTITDTAEQWRRVGTVQVGILASSPNRAASAQPTTNRQVMGVAFAPPTGDTHFRATYETTVALRNRLFGN
ncbi:PilW family protein [Stenotrophomonas sp. Marseille-Q4652]|uniref:PilW family protein n=1 Tax=Stenotrophomonas sp. Marseille-Q4652 TaxID=2866595 RepID=UPI001CE419A6|nr:PilW family protein [Stenotrophomonas sp. Marseille-Q4652]